MEQKYKNFLIKIYPRKGKFRANVYPVFRTPTKGSLQIGCFNGETEEIVLKRAIEDIDKYFDRLPVAEGSRCLLPFSKQPLASHV